MKEKFKVLVGVMAVMSAGVHFFTGVLNVALLAGLGLVLAALLYRNRVLLASGEILRPDAADVLFLAACVFGAVFIIDGTAEMKSVYAGAAVPAMFFRKLWLKQPVLSEMQNS